jgi:micrococcal nuclease
MKKQYYFAPGTVEAYATRCARKLQRSQLVKWSLFVTACVLIGYVCTSKAQAEPKGPYEVTEAVRVIDGDTFVARFEIYPGIWLEKSVRVLGADTPEKSAQQVCERTLAKKAQEFMQVTMDAAAKSKQTLQLWHVVDDKYGGRVDATVTIGGVDLAKTIIAANVGRPYQGGRRQSWCVDSTGPPPAVTRPASAEIAILNRNNNGNTSNKDKADDG